MMKTMIDRELRLLVLVTSLLPMSHLAQAQELPNGKGKEVVQQTCGLCHETALIVYHGAAKKQDWSFLVDDMISRGASASAEQIQAIKDYLVKQFGLVNVNRAPAVEIAEILEIKPEQAEAIVSYRADHGPFKTIADLKKITGIESIPLESKKDRISF
jgi:competence ComEA-like helix-hairpin-helix protein